MRGTARAARPARPAWRASMPGQRSGRRRWGSGWGQGARRRGVQGQSGGCVCCASPRARVCAQACRPAAIGPGRGRTLAPCRRCVLPPASILASCRCGGGQHAGTPRQPGEVTSAAGRATRLEISSSGTYTSAHTHTAIILLVASPHPDSPSGSFSSHVVRTHTLAARARCHRNGKRLPSSSLKSAAAASTHWLSQANQLATLRRLPA